LNSFAERWVKSVKEECLSKLILFGEKSLRHVLREYVVRHHHGRNHQGKENLLLFPASEHSHQSEREVRCRGRLGGLLRSTIGKPHEYFDLTGSVESILENGETVGMLASGAVRGRKL